MSPRVALFGALLLVAIPALATAQERSCRQVLPSDARRLVNAQGQEIIYFRDPVRVLCSGGLRLEADSAIMNRDEGMVQLVGNVFYRDSLRELTSDWANYIGQRDQFLARGNVVLRNPGDGSVVQGDELDYLQRTTTRPVTRMVVRGDRPYAVIPPQPDSLGQVADTAVSTEVWADRMEFEGEEIFRALGAVEIRRGTTTGAGDMAIFDQPAERMTLTGGAHVTTDRYRLEGQRIDAYLSGQELRTVIADRAARVESENLNVEADRVRIGFLEGRLQRMEAWNPEPDSVPRALADAEGFRLRADSIDARADSLGIEEVRAVGRAYGERDADSLDADAPRAIARDWIQGDTILGFFGRRTVGDTLTLDATPEPGTGGAAATGDSTETVLERIVVIGGRQAALSLYRMRGEEGGEAAFNFMKATTITLHLENGDVSWVEADGPLDGVYLSPAEEREEGEDAEEAAENGGGGPGPAGDRPGRSRVGGGR